MCVLVATGVWTARRRTAGTAADGQQLEETTLVWQVPKTPREAGPEAEV